MLPSFPAALPTPAPFLRLFLFVPVLFRLFLPFFRGEFLRDSSRARSGVLKGIPGFIPKPKPKPWSGSREFQALGLGTLFFSRELFSRVCRKREKHQLRRTKTGFLSKICLQVDSPQKVARICAVSLPEPMLADLVLGILSVPNRSVFRSFLNEHFLEKMRSGANIRRISILTSPLCSPNVADQSFFLFH